jgi:hypothetical protein
MRRVRTENATIGSSQGGATDMTVPIAGVAIKPDLQRTTMAGIRARTISTASGPAPILAHTGVAGLPRGRGSSDRARRSALKHGTRSEQIDDADVLLGPAQNGMSFTARFEKKHKSSYFTGLIAISQNNLLFSYSY